MNDKSDFKELRSRFEGMRNIFNADMLINDRNLFITQRDNHFIKRLIERVPHKHHIRLMEKIITRISKFEFYDRIYGRTKLRFDKYKVVVCFVTEMVCDRLCVTVTTVYNQNEHLHS